MRTVPLYIGLVTLIAPTAAAQEDYLPAAALQEAGLVKYWQLQLPLESGQQIQHAYLVDDQLYLGTQDGYVFAVHAPTGVIRWLQPVSRSAYPLRRPCHAGDNVVFVTPTDMQIYNRRTGEPIARRDLRFPAGTGGVSDGDQVFVGGLDRRLYAISVATQFVNWKVLTGGPITSTPVVRDQRIYFANDAGQVYCCTRDDKTLVWQATTHGRISADLVVTEAGVFVACRDFSLYLLDPNYGNVRWRARLSGPLQDPPVVTSGLAYQYSPAEGLVAVEATAVGIVEKRVRWTLANGRMALTVANDWVYVLTGDETLAAVDVGNGQMRYAVPAGGFTIGLPAPQDQTVWLASYDGRIFCARPRGTPPLHKDDLLAALRSATEPEPTPAAATPAAPSAVAEDPLRSKRQGLPIGGKSKVSREFRGGGGAQ